MTCSDTTGNRRTGLGATPEGCPPEGAAPVFVSYSRKDYYFAESLSFELQQAAVPAWLDSKDLEPGVDWEDRLFAAIDAAPAFILVATPDSLSSQNVRAEWQRALARNRRVLVAEFRRASPPPELAGCERVDFRGAFRPALRQLVDLLQQRSSPGARWHSDQTRGRQLPRPPWVLLLGGLFAILALFPLVAADYRDVAGIDGGKMPLGPVELVILVAAVAAFLWYFALAFLWRQMSMTRLAMSFGYFAFACGYPLLQLAAGPAVPRLFPEATMRLVREWPAVVAGLLMLALAGLAIVAIVRPRDLLRWTPTGRAWSGYRSAFGGAQVSRPAGIAAAFSGLHRFRLLHDDMDAPVADRLRHELSLRGAVEAPASAADATSVLLLTNRTRASWVAQHESLSRAPLLTVVGAGIRLPEALGWLWRRQWVDFRRWTATVPVQRSSLPDVPERLSGLRLPAAIRRVHLLLCALGALLFALAGKLMPETIDETAGVDPAQQLAMIVGICGTLPPLLLARRLLRRTLPARRWRIALPPAVGLAAALAGFALWQQFLDGLSAARLAMVVAFVVAAPALLHRERRHVAWWLPVHAASRADAKDSLDPGRNWRTLAAFIAFSLFWIAVLDPTILAAGP